jgi:phage tail-like protein
MGIINWRPTLSFRFRVEIKGILWAGFSDVSGLTMENEIYSFKEGGLNTYERQLPGPNKFPSKLIMKRGWGDNELWLWYRDILQGRIKRKNVAVIWMDSAGEEQKRWVFRDACPVKWTGPEFKAGTAEVAFESVELVHRGWE